MEYSNIFKTMLIATLIHGKIDMSLRKQSRRENDGFHLGLNLLEVLTKDVDYYPPHPKASKLKIQGDPEFCIINKHPWWL